MDGMGLWATLVALAEPALHPAAHLWGADFTWLELVAVVLSLAMVALNLRVNPWAWPFAIAASVLYAVLFAHYRLYGEASLQGLFIVVSFWGWWQWLRGTDAQRRPLAVRALPRSGVAATVCAWGLMWLGIGLLLDHITDSDVPYWDALPTAGSVAGQYLLARKWVENWPVWLAVNLISVALFVYKGMWLTVGLYALFAVLSVVGWRAWRGLARTAATGA